MSAATSGRVTIYPKKASKPLAGADYMRGTLIHETGHTWSKKKWGNDTTRGKWLDWKKAIEADKSSVSKYAKASISEDVAETLQIYVSTKGSPKYDEYAAIVPNRFKMLGTEYGP